MRKIIVCLLAVIVVLTGCSVKTGDGFKYKYGVFLGAEPEDMDAVSQYEIIVIDAQYFSRKEIAELKSEGHTVFSYINVGSLEEFRPYYDDYSEYTLSVYENWEDEMWVDVSAPEWQDLIIDDLAADLKDKGVDGLFVDNVDVYYHYQTEEVYEALSYILKSFKDMGFYVSINGGDTFVTECIDRGEPVKSMFDAVNQETVFSKIIWEEEDTFSVQDDAENEYFLDYLKRVHKEGIDVYLLEYTTDKELTKEIEEYCAENGYFFYISKTLNLEAA